MESVLYYNGFLSEIEFSSEDNVFYGKISGIRDLVSFHAKNESDIEQAFHDAVDDYLKFCSEVGKNARKK
jgi:predicted HicB family RNase H-like nuclease